jgi:hypothetical protein
MVMALGVLKNLREIPLLLPVALVLVALLLWSGRNEKRTNFPK